MGKLANAMGKINYKGHWGGSIGDFGEAVTGLVGQAKADKEKKADAAYKAALLKVQQDKATADLESTSWDRNFKEKDFKFRTTEAAADNERASKEFAARMAQQEEDRLLREQNQLMLNEDRDSSRAQNREMTTWLRRQGDERVDMAQNKGQVIWDEDNNPWYWNPTTQKGSRLKVENGVLVPETPGASGNPIDIGNGQTRSATPRPTGGHGMPGSEPIVERRQPKAQEPVVLPGGEPAATVQPGVTADPDSSHTEESPPVPTSRPFRKPVPQGELDAASSFGQLRGLMGDLTKQMSGVDYQPPGAATQFGLEMSKQGGMLPGIPDSWERLGGNIAVGAFAPDYQSLEATNNALSTFLVKMITGAQMSQQEADRIRSLVAMRAGDNPEVVQLRLKQAQGIIDAAEKRVSKRSRQAVGLEHEEGPNLAQDYYNLLRRQGKSDEEAAALTDEVYGP